MTNNDLQKIHRKINIEKYEPHKIEPIHDYNKPFLERTISECIYP